MTLASFMTRPGSVSFLGARRTRGGLQCEQCERACHLPVEDACDPFGEDVGVCFHVVSEPLGDVPEDAEREMVDDEREVVRGEGQVCAKLVDDGFNDVV